MSLCKSWKSFFALKGWEIRKPGIRNKIWNNALQWNYFKPFKCQQMSEMRWKEHPGTTSFMTEFQNIWNKRALYFKQIWYFKMLKRCDRWNAMQWNYFKPFKCQKMSEMKLKVHPETTSFITEFKHIWSKCAISSKFYMLQMECTKYLSIHPGTSCLILYLKEFWWERNC